MKYFLKPRWYDIWNEVDQETYLKIQNIFSIKNTELGFYGIGIEGKIELKQ